MHSIRVLYLEDNADHVALVSDCLKVQFPELRLESVHRLEDALQCLSGRTYDIVLVSAFLQSGPTMSRLKELTEAANDSPLIVIAGSGEEKNAANAIKKGATDYLVKSRESLELLPYLALRLLKKRRPISHQKLHPTSTEDPVSALLNEIDLVARRVHSLQEPSLTDASITALRDEIQQLKQYALTLENQKNRKKLKS